MNHSRKVLEAEKKRTESTSDGYLKHSRAFRFTRAIHATPHRDNSTSRSDTDNDDTDVDYSDANHDTKGEYSGCDATNMGAIHSDRAWRPNMQQSPTARSLPASPVPRRVQHEAKVAAAARGVGVSTMRGTASLGVRQGLRVVSERSSNTTARTVAAAAPSGGGGGSSFTAAASRYAAPSPTKRSEGSHSPVPLTGSRFAAPTVASRLKEHSPQSLPTLRLHSPQFGNMERCSVTAGLSPAKTTRTAEAAGVTDNCGHDSPWKKAAVVEEGGRRYRRPCAAPSTANAAATSFTNSSAASMAEQRAQLPPRPPPPARKAAATTTTPQLLPISPPLRAVVSPRSSLYRQHHHSNDFPQSVTCTPPSCVDGETCASPNGSPQRASSLVLPPVVETDGHRSPMDSAETLRLSHHSRASNRLSRLPSHHGVCEPSGFINSGNDCYACSVLTFLLRSPAFCRALFAAPVLEYRGESGDGNNSNNNNNDNKNDVTRPMLSTCHPSSRKPVDCLHNALLNYARLLRRPNTIVCGLDMSPLQGFLRGFFTGNQEDAHEFFMALIDKLEEESIEVLKLRDKAENGSNLSAVTEADANELFRDDANEAKTSNADNHSINPKKTWVNELLQGTFLNIIRCRNEGCGHEIATEDPFVNLTVNLKKKETIEVPADSLPLPPTPQNDATFSAATDVRPYLPPDERNGTDGSPSAAAEITTSSDCYDVQSLLEQSLRFASLDAYICDACGSKEHQHQGGCLLGAAPSLLVFQLKRFATTFDKTMGLRVSKDRTPVRVNEELTLYALREEGQYDREKKQLAPSVREAERAAMQKHQQRQQQEPSREYATEERLSVQPDEKGNINTSLTEKSKHHQKLQEKPDENEREDEGPDTRLSAIRSLYRLQGVVKHIGHSPSAGHYVAEFAVTPDTRGCENGNGNNPNTLFNEDVKLNSEWQLANDDGVTTMREDEVGRQRRNSSNCYLLLYEKVAEEDVLCPVWRVLPQWVE